MSGSQFWNFSLAVYGAPGVQDECLALQDRFGVDVNLLLLGAFVGAANGARLSADDIVSARGEVASWHEDIVKPLRQARRRLKAAAATDAAAAQLRAQVKAAELEAERIEQTMLERWTEARRAAWPRGDRRDAIAANMAMLLTSYVAEAELPAATEHLAAAALVRF